MRIETVRLRLRPLQDADADWLSRMLADPAVMAHADLSPVDDRELAAQIVAGQVDSMAAGRALYWAIERTGDDGAPIGCCDLSDIDRWHRRAEIGFMLRPDVWRQGYAAETVRALIDFARRDGFERLGARAHLGNIASDSLLREQGFAREGLLRAHVLRDGERRDCRVYGLLL